MPAATFPHRDVIVINPQGIPPSLIRYARNLYETYSLRKYIKQSQRPNTIVVFGIVGVVDVGNTKNVSKINSQLLLKNIPDAKWNAEVKTIDIVFEVIAAPIVLIFCA